MKLAIHGGEKVIKKPFSAYNSLGKEELEAAVRVIRSGQLSGFLGSWNDKFYGGPKVREFENTFAEMFNVEHAVAFNSLTSGLVASIGALGLEPGEEVIISPWTMSATISAVLAWNAIPVFADIEAETFNLDPDSIKKCITPRTKAVIVADIFGHPARMDEIMDICSSHDIKVVEDAAQAPHVSYKDKFAGCVGDIGGFSLNCHKLIQTGEGGIMVTNNSSYAERMRLIRNHGESVVGPKGETDISNIIGYNFRMCEIEAAMAILQLKKLPDLAKMRLKTGQKLMAGLQGLQGLSTPVIHSDCSHSFYIFGLTIDTKKLGIDRNTILRALQAEGVPHISSGYQLLHLLPMLQKRIAYGSKGFPWTADFYDGNVSYTQGICPVAERLHLRDFIALQLSALNYNNEETELVVEAFKKVWKNSNNLS